MAEPERFVDEKSKRESIFVRGSFLPRSRAAAMQQVAGNLGGIVVEMLGDALTDGTLIPDSQRGEYTGIRVTREDGSSDLTAFWAEVNRAEAEAIKRFIKK